MFCSHIRLRLFMKTYAGSTFCGCMGATSQELKCHEATHIVQSATCKLLHMKNKFKCFGSLSIVILIMILIVLDNVYVLD